MWDGCGMGGWRGAEAHRDKNSGCFCLVALSGVIGQGCVSLYSPPCVGVGYKYRSRLGVMALPLGVSSFRVVQLDSPVYSPGVIL